MRQRATATGAASGGVVGVGERAQRTGGAGIGDAAQLAGFVVRIGGDDAIGIGHAGGVVGVVVGVGDGLQYVVVAGPGRLLDLGQAVGVVVGVADHRLAGDGQGGAPLGQIVQITDGALIAGFRKQVIDIVVTARERAGVAVNDAGEAVAVIPGKGGAAGGTGVTGIGAVVDGGDAAQGIVAQVGDLAVVVDALADQSAGFIAQTRVLAERVGDVLDLVACGIGVADGVEFFICLGQDVTGRIVSQLQHAAFGVGHAGHPVEGIIRHVGAVVEHVGDAGQATDGIGHDAHGAGQRVGGRLKITTAIGIVGHVTQPVFAAQTAALAVVDHDLGVSQSIAGLGQVAEVVIGQRQAVT